MEDRFINLIYELKEAINDDPRVIKLNEIELELSSNRDVINLSIKKNRISEEYKEILRFNDENSELAKAKQKELYLAKKELDELDIVIKYNKAFQEVRLLYEHISSTLFDELKIKRDCHLWLE